MATSVPQVWPINDAKYRFGTIIEKALEVYQLSGDIKLLDQAVRLTREFMDSEMKIAGHKGALSWEHIHKCSMALEDLEQFVEKRRRKEVALK